MKIIMIVAMLTEGLMVHIMEPPTEIDGRMSSRPIGIAAADTSAVGSTSAVGKERFKVYNGIYKLVVMELQLIINLKL